MTITRFLKKSLPIMDPSRGPVYDHAIGGEEALSIEPNFGYRPQDRKP